MKFISNFLLIVYVVHTILLDDKVWEFLSKLPKELQKRIYYKLESTSNNPFHFFERLTKRTDYKLRIGDYRIIADIDNKRIVVTSIGHRKNIYK